MSSSPANIFEAHPIVFERAQTEGVKPPPDGRWRTPFSVKEIVLSSIFLVVLCAALVAVLAHYPYYPCCFGQLSAAIRHWNFRGLDPSQPKEFWGFSYVAALLATLTRLPDDFAIVIISSCMFVLANYFCCRLWGTMVSAWFLVVNWWWLDVAAEGMTEPLFMALLLGAFIAVRKERWVLAALLASASTVVRPVGIFALLAIGIVLLRRWKLRLLAIAIAIGLITGILYTIPMKLVYGNPFANMKGYHSNDWSSALPVTVPLLPLIKGALMTPGTRWKLQILIAAWALITLAAAIKLAVDKRFWRYAKMYPTEALFAGFYALFLFSYNAPFWAWNHFPRFAIPLLPFLLLVFIDRLPRDRRIIWAIALFNVSLTVWPKAPAIHSLHIPAAVINMLNKADTVG